MSSRRSRAGGGSNGTSLIASILISILDEKNNRGLGPLSGSSGFSYCQIHKSVSFEASVRLPAALPLRRSSGRNSNPEEDV
jgi:hypothetical protein